MAFLKELLKHSHNNNLTASLIGMQATPASMCTAASSTFIMRNRQSAIALNIPTTRFASLLLDLIVLVFLFYFSYTLCQPPHPTPSQPDGEAHATRAPESHRLHPGFPDGRRRGIEESDGVPTCLPVGPELNCGLSSIGDQRSAPNRFTSFHPRHCFTCVGLLDLEALGIGLNWCLLFTFSAFWPCGSRPAHPRPLLKLPLGL